METIILTPQNTPLQVKQGGLDLFHQDRETQQLHSLLHLDEGQVAFGFSDNIDPTSMQIVAIPLPETKLDVVAIDKVTEAQFRAWFSQWQALFSNLPAEPELANEETLLAWNREIWCVCQALHDEKAKSFTTQLDAAKGHKTQTLARVQQLLHQSFDLSRRADLGAHPGLTNPAIKALAIVADYVGVNVDFDATKLSETETYLNYLQRTCEISGLHLRLVKLTGQWWKQCTDPFVVFDAEENPIAVIPKIGGRSDFIDVATGKVLALSQEAIKALQPLALGVHSAFPSEDKVTLKEMLRVGFRHNGWDMIALIIVALVVAGLGALPPILMGKLVGSAIPKNQVDYLIELPLILLTAAIVILGFNFIKELFIIKITARSTIQLQSALLHRVLRLPVNFFQRYNTGELTNRVLSFQEISQTFSGTQINVVFTVIFGVVNLIVMFVYLPLLAVYVLGFVIVYILLMSVFSYYRVKIITDYMEYEAKASGFAFQLLKGVAKLKSTATEALGLHGWSKIFTPSQHCQYRMNRLTKWENLISQTVSLLVLIIIYLIIAAGWLGTVDVAEYVAFNSAYLQFFAAMGSITLVLNALLRARVQLKRAKPILTAATEQQAGERRLSRPTLEGKITFSDVSFSYDPDKGPMILKNIDFAVEPGQFVAIVGESGGGKSTLFRLLLGFEAPTTGNILYDGYRLDDLDRQYTRRQLGVVLQQAKVFGGSIFDNIVGANIELTQDDAWEIAKLSGFDEDIKAMPMGMNTILPDGGGVLSGGQRQRLLIARALALRPKILMLDEATSALDNKTQKVVMDSIEAMQTTRIVIAHRLSTIVNADMILVLDQGKVVERGDYQTLMAQKGLFYRLAQRQV